MARRFCLPHHRALWYTHVNSGSLPCAPRCGDPLYHMLETPTFPSKVLSTLSTCGVSQEKKDMWSSNPTRPCQHDLTSGEFLDPLHVNTQPPNPSSITHVYPDEAARDAWMPYWYGNKFQTYLGHITIRYKCRYQTTP